MVRKLRVIKVVTIHEQGGENGLPA